MKMIVGIDPGASGALVLLEDGIPIEWTLMPTYKVGTATRVHASEVAHFLEWGKYVDHVFIEQVHAMPGQGVTSMFNFGHSCGTVVGVVGALGYPHTMVQPQKWKKAAGLSGTDKDAARSRAIQLWPQWKDLAQKGKGQAFADAALIARFGA
jgi:crossover junction endodeoxyribonuclease RuvC